MACPSVKTSGRAVRSRFPMKNRESSTAIPHAKVQTFGFSSETEIFNKKICLLFISRRFSQIKSICFSTRSSLPSNRTVILQKFSAPMFACINPVKQRIHNSRRSVNNIQRRLKILLFLFSLG
ncbi:hypothetical protein C8P67_102511 [Flavobacterium aquicola]|uniref:Uncharacterized protein n=1 Tax=Flavobacterium aquicola TaxID=1682742 RepID=A0A3E0ETW1_9FLAO|nr:hypothetical protein C8P67_102511 [Flavobacterium aquicola]